MRPPCRPTMTAWAERPPASPTPRARLYSAGGLLRLVQRTCSTQQLLCFTKMLKNSKIENLGLWIEQRAV